MTSAWADWIEREMTRRGWRAADTARALEVDDSLISRWRRGKQVPDMDSCRSIASQLDLPVLTVLVAAGHLTPAEAGQKSMAALTPAELSTDEVVAELIELSNEIQRRVADLRSEVDELRGGGSGEVDDPKGPVGLNVPGIPNRRAKASARRNLK